MENGHLYGKEHERNEEQKGGSVKRFFKAVFVHNFWAKLSAIVVSAALWVLAVGLA